MTMTIEETGNVRK